MIQKFYGLEQDAFSLSPDLDFLFLSKSHEEAVAHLAYGLEQNEDIILICGDIGTGKTLALHRLVEQVSTSFVPVLITVTTLDFEQLLRLILMKLGVELGSNSGAAELIFLFEKTLVEARQHGKKVLLIIDESQNLPVEALESVRLLMNLGQPGGQALQLVLAGQLGLRSNLELPQMRQLQQRIRVDYQLEFLTRDELEAYILHRLKVAGRDQLLFKRDALDKIHNLSKGVPRVVNHLASKALLSGFVEEAGKISAKHVEDVVSGAPADSGTGATTRTVHSDPPPGIQEEPEMDWGEEDVEVLVEKFAEIPVEAPLPEPLRAPHSETYAGKESSNRKSHRGRWTLAVVIIVIAGAVWSYSRWSPVLIDLVAREDVAPAQTQMPEPTAARIETPVENAVTTADTTMGDQALETPPVSGEEVAVTPSEVQETATETETPSTEIDLEDTWLVHVASFRQEDRSINFTKKLISKGIEAEHRPVKNEKGETWHRVYVGPFLDRQDAYKAALTMKEEGLIEFSRLTRY